MKYVFVLAILMIGLVSAGVQICIDLDAPSVPGDLEVSGNSGNIMIFWSEATDEPDCSGIKEYVVSRNSVEIGRVSHNTTSFVDNNSLGPGSYNYTVYAIDMVGNNAGNSIKNYIQINSRGGSSGGGSFTSFECVPNWTCENWDECVDGYQNRTCIDTNNCGTVSMKPEEAVECSIIEEELAEEISTEEESPGFFSTITGAAIGAISTPEGVLAAVFITILLASGILIRIKTKKLKKKN